MKIFGEPTGYILRISDDIVANGPPPWPWIGTAHCTIDQANTANIKGLMMKNGYTREVWDAVGEWIGRHGALEAIWTRRTSSGDMRLVRVKVAGDGKLVYLP